MNILTMNVLQETANLLPGTAMCRAGGVQETSSFANFLTQSQAATNKHLDNLFGVSVATAAGAGGKAGEPGTPLDKSINLGAIDTVAGLLQQMMTILNQQAAPAQIGPGDWLVALPDTGVLEMLGQAAGMTSEQLSKFMQPFINGEAKVSLGELLDALASHFATLTSDQPITVPDTDLPLFQSLLARMGVDVQSRDAIASKAITNDDTLDLTLLLVALKELAANAEAAAVPLSAVDLEQLQAILQRAGLPADQLQALLPATGGQAGQPALTAEPPAVTMSVQGLQDLLAQAIQDIQGARPQVDATAFLQRLEEVFTQAGFQEQGVGWTPVVQNAIESIYQELLATVNPATVQVRGGQPALVSVVPVSGTPATPLSGQSGDEVMPLAQETEAVPAVSALPVGESAQLGLENKPEKPLDDLDPEAQLATISTGAGKETTMAQEVAKAAAPLPRPEPVLVQQTMEQLSQGVLHGARNNEHHLVLRLFPEDLGEVKVVLHMHNKQVSVDFSMHNHQVKEILEQNMQQFRENLEKHGFVLEQCSASLDSHDKGSNGQQNFDLAMRQPWEGGKGGVADLPDDVLYRQATNPAKAGGIDLFM